MDLKFWKKDDDGLDSFPDLPEGNDSAFSQSPDVSQGFSAPDTSAEQFSAPMQQAPQQPQQASVSGDDDVHTQLILARLDAITNKLDVLSSRMERMEGQIANMQQQQPQQAQKPRGPWYGN